MHSGALSPDQRTLFHSSVFHNAVFTSRGHREKIYYAKDWELFDTEIMAGEPEFGHNLQLRS